MEAMNISGEFNKLESIYIHKLLDIVSSLPTQNGYIIWQVKIYHPYKILLQWVIKTKTKRGLNIVMSLHVCDVLLLGGG